MPDERISYQTWGEQFFASAISEERLLGAVNDLAGQPIDVGPIAVGPGRIAKVSANGAIGEARASRLHRADASAPIGFRVALPVDLTFDLDLSVEVQRFTAALVVPLTLTAVALDGVRIWVDIEPPSARDVEVRVQASGLRGEILKRVADIEGELRRFVVGYVARELDKPHVQRARLIDVGAMIDKAWSMLKPAPAPPAGVVADLTEALEEEVTTRERFLFGEEQ